MFRGRIACILGLCLGLVCFLWNQLSVSSLEERRALQQLMQQSSAVSASDSTTQRRSHVRRDLLASSAAPLRQHTVLFCDTADIQIDWIDNNIAETMKGLKGYSKEETPQGRLVRHIIAQSATYQHREARLEAKEVELEQWNQVAESADWMALVEPEERGEAAVFILYANDQPTAFEAEQFWLQSMKDDGSLQSSQAHFDGTRLFLTGDAEIVLPQVSAKAQHICLQPASAEVERLLLTENVDLTLSDGTCLQCDEAEINVAAGSGVFIGKRRPVRGSFAASEQRGKVHIQADHLQIQTQEVEASERILSSAIARGHAHLEEPEVWRASGAEIHYGAEQGGSLELKSRDSELCTIDKVDTGQLEAQHIYANLGKKQARAQMAKGRVSPVEGPAVTFAANNLLWDQDARTLFFEEDVLVEQQGAARLQTDEALRIYYDEQQQITQMNIKGNIVIESTLPKRNLYCPGECVVDFIGHHVQLSSTHPVGQVVFAEEGTHLLANELLFHYEPVEGQWQPRQIEARGKVRLKNHYGLRIGSEATQYALADRLRSWPQERKLDLSSDYPTRVLLLDSGNGLAVSAPQVLVQPDTIHGKERVRGVGDVRLTLLDKEYQMLRQRFHMKESGKK